MQGYWCVADVEEMIQQAKLRFPDLIVGIEGTQGSCELSILRNLASPAFGKHDVYLFKDMDHFLNSKFASNGYQAGAVTFKRWRFNNGVHEEGLLTLLKSFEFPDKETKRIQFSIHRNCLKWIRENSAPVLLYIESIDCSVETRITWRMLAEMEKGTQVCYSRLSNLASIPYANIEFLKTNWASARRMKVESRQGPPNILSMQDAYSEEDRLR